jgi:hypothetical protein
MKMEIEIPVRIRLRINENMLGEAIKVIGIGGDETFPAGELEEVPGEEIHGASTKYVTKDGVHKTHSKWTADQIKFLLDNPGMPIEEMAKALGKTKQACYWKRCEQKHPQGKYKKSGDKRRRWNPEELSFLKDHLDMHITELAERFHKPISAVYKKIRDLGLSKKLNRKNGSSSHSAWSAENDKFIMENKDKMKKSEMARTLGRTKGSITMRMWQLENKRVTSRKE